MYFSLKKLCLKKESRQLPTFPLKSSIIGVRELDFRVRNGNGYYLSTMATSIYYYAKTKCVRRLLVHAGRIFKKMSCFMNGNDDMAKSHDLLVMLG